MNRDSIHLPIVAPDSASMTCLPMDSIQTILSIDSSSSQSRNESCSTVFVPPLSTLPDISDFQSNTSVVSCQSSLTFLVPYSDCRWYNYPKSGVVYHGNPHAITPSHGNSMRQSGSMMDLDEAFKMTVNRARGTHGLFGGFH